VKRTPTHGIHHMLRDSDYRSWMRNDWSIMDPKIWTQKWLKIRYNTGHEKTLHSRL